MVLVGRRGKWGTRSCVVAGPVYIWMILDKREVPCMGHRSVREILRYASLPSACSLFDDAWCLIELDLLVCKLSLLPISHLWWLFDWSLQQLDYLVLSLHPIGVVGLRREHVVWGLIVQDLLLWNQWGVVWVDGHVEFYSCEFVKCPPECANKEGVTVGYDLQG